AGLDAAPAQHGDQEARDDGGVEPLLRLHAGGDGEGDGERERDDADDEAGREVPPELGAAVPLAEDGHELRLKRVQRGFGKGRRCRPAVRLYRRSGSAPNEEMAKRTEPSAPGHEPPSSFRIQSFGSMATSALRGTSIMPSPPGIGTRRVSPPTATSTGRSKG